jgi:NDP-sugar pyrophosphorylase family protein
MHAIILVDRDGQELWPLTARRPVALLPVGNKPLIQITLEELYDLGIRRATVVATAFSEEISRFLSDGGRFGMELDHAVTRQPARLPEILAAINLEPNRDWMAVRGDMLRPMGFLSEALSRRDKIASADIFVAMGIALPDRKSPFGQDISWPSVCSHCNLHPCLIDNLATYHSANVMALRGLVPGVRLPGRPLPDQTVVGAGSVVKCRRAPDIAVNIGERCRINDATELGENTVIGDGSIVDVGSNLRNAVVLPGTYVGRNLAIEDAIVDGHLVICSRTGAIASFNEASLLTGTGL